MSSAGRRPSWQAIDSVGTSIVPPGPCPPPKDMPGASPAVTTPQATASLHDFAAPLVRDVTFREDAQKARTGNLPANCAAIRNLVIGAIRKAGFANIRSPRPPLLRPRRPANSRTLRIRLNRHPEHQVT